MLFLVFLDLLRGRFCGDFSLRNHKIKIDWFYTVVGFIHLMITHSEHIDVESEKTLLPSVGMRICRFYGASKLHFNDANNTRMTLQEAKNHCICKCFRLRAFRVLAFVFDVDIAWVPKIISIYSVLEF